MIHRWDLLTFLHWRYPIDEVQNLLPDGLAVESYDGAAWVGLVPFMMDVRPPRAPSVPWLSRFCETNVRTYVRARDGTTGVWFFSLDAERLPAVVTARTTYRLPYFWSTMSLKQSSEGDRRRFDYDCQRRWPGPKVRSRVAVSVGAEFADSELFDFDHFLTARWRLYSAHHRAAGTGLRYALAAHDPWPLYRATVIDVDDGLVAAAGLTQPETDPVAHWSPGVEVRIGFPHRLRTEAS